MRKCKYCKKPVGFLGFFTGYHRECKKKYEKAWQDMVEISKESVLGLHPLENLMEKLKQIAQQGFVEPERIREALIRGWEETAWHFLNDGGLDKEEEKKLVEFMNFFNLSQEELDKRGLYTKVVKGGVLRDLMEGKLPNRYKVEVTLPLNFKKGETIVWLFNDVDYFETKKVRKYVGGSHGMSIRIAKGVYYRVGGFRGRPVEERKVHHVDKGMMAITNKHVYFHGSVKSFRIPYSKIVSFVPYSDGVGIYRDVSNAELQIFKTEDGWFTYNLLVNLASMSVELSG